MKTILQYILAQLSKSVVRKYQPQIIGITGSVGKTSAKEAIYTVLSSRWNVWKSQKSYNTEIGLPLTIINATNQYRDVVGWIREVFKAAGFLFKTKPYPKMLILEYGVQNPGDMDVLLHIAKPNVALVTSIGDTPVHIEFFKNADSVFLEKIKLIKCLRKSDYALLNCDDRRLANAKKFSKAEVIFYGFDECADMRVENLQLRITKDAQLGDIPDGISFKLSYQGNSVPVRLHDTFGIPQAYAAAAAACVGMLFGMNLVEISEALSSSYKPPAGRLRLLKGIKKSFILDDTYNASPDSMRAALDTLKNLPGIRKIAVLGDMLELGEYTEQAHRDIGRLAAQYVDFIFAVGPRSTIIIDEALAAGMPRSKVFHFDGSVEAGRALDPFIQKGDLVLVKGSQGMRMEKAVKEVMAHPERAEELLVRQDEFWRNK